MYKIGICGHFAYGKHSLNGQTVKTKIVTKELKKQLGSSEIYTLDTYGWKKNPFKLIYLLFKMLKNSKHIIILPAQRGLKVFVPIILLFNILFKRKLHYIVIGGWLPRILSTNKYLKNLLNNFDGIYVETKTMASYLNNLNMHNIHILPNFKSIQVLGEKSFSTNISFPLKVCTFSRVMKEKGIEDAIEVVNKINQQMNKKIVLLDIYGQIDDNYQKKFHELRENFPSEIKYKGLIDFDKSVGILKNYFLLLFPTKYEGEGFPGTVIDAFSSALPIVATNWKYNSEIITDNKTGFIYNNSLAELKSLLLQLINNPQLVMNLKNNCLEEAKKYDSKVVINQLLNDMKIREDMK